MAMNTCFCQSTNRVDMKNISILEVEESGVGGGGGGGDRGRASVGNMKSDI